MSAPLVVNTRDGSCWTRRTVLKDGTALYALVDVCQCPELVMATQAELADIGIVGSADALPMPVGPSVPVLPETALDTVREILRAHYDGLPRAEMAVGLLLTNLRDELLVEPSAAEVAIPWAHAMSDDDLHGFLGDLVSAAMGRWQHSPEVPDREVLAAVEKACAAWRTPGEGYRSDEAPYVSRLLPPRDAVCARPGCGHLGVEHHHGDTKCWATLPRTRQPNGAWSAVPTCGCEGFVAKAGEPS